jgi:hypothetical protein
MRWIAALSEPPYQKLQQKRSVLQPVKGALWPVVKEIDHNLSHSLRDGRARTYIPDLRTEIIDMSRW